MSYMLSRYKVDSARGCAASRIQKYVSVAASITVLSLCVPDAVGAQQAEGGKLFQQRCGVCHSMDPGQKKAGPHLAGLIGRPAGKVEGVRYSDAMRASGIVWNSRSLDSFLAAPRKVVPGTQMSVSVPAAPQRAAIIAYLAGAE